MNEQIRISPIRLIGAEGEQLGVVPTVQALAKAREAGLDLVEVAADERPPVCRILDYGKCGSRPRRRATSQQGPPAEAEGDSRSPQDGRPRHGDQGRSGAQVSRTQRQGSVTVIFRGREMQHQEEGRRVLDSVLEKLAAVGKMERPPTMDGKKMTALIMPNKSAAKPKPKPPAEPTQEKASRPTPPAEATQEKAPSRRRRRKPRRRRLPSRPPENSRQAAMGMVQKVTFGRTSPDRPAHERSVSLAERSSRRGHDRHRRPGRPHHSSGGQRLHAAGDPDQTLSIL